MAVVWKKLAYALDLPVGANPTATAGLVVVNGSAATFLRSDAAPAVGALSNPGAAAAILATDAQGRLLINAAYHQAGGSIFAISGTMGADATTGIAAGGYFSVRTTAAAFTLSSAYGIYIDVGVKGAGSTITTAYGLYISEQTVGATNWAIYCSGGDSYFANDIYSDGAAHFEGDIRSGNNVIANIALKSEAVSNQIVLQSTGVTGTLSWTPATSDKVITLPDLTGTLPLGAGTLTVATTNSVTVADHTHAITASSAPGAASSLVKTDANGAWSMSGNCSFVSTTDSTVYTNGSVVVSGGVGIAKHLVIPTTSGTTGYGLKFDSGANGLVASFQGLDLAGGSYLFFSTNRHFDGTNWQQLNTRVGGTLQVAVDTLAYYTFAASSSTAVNRFTVDNAGVATLYTGGLIIGGTTTGAASSTSFTNVTNTTLTNAYIVKGGQAANTVNTGWIKIFIGTNAAWVPYWTNATP